MNQQHMNQLYPVATTSPTDREAFEERAAIMAFDGEMSRAEAESLAAFQTAPTNRERSLKWKQSN
jgi:hypothetical protein